MNISGKLGKEVQRRKGDCKRPGGMEREEKTFQGKETVLFMVEEHFPGGFGGFECCFNTANRFP